MRQSDGEDEDVLAVLDDEYATDILVETSAEPRSARRLAELCDASRSTVYRRIERLQAHDLLETRQQLDPEGHHREVYAARLQRVTVELTDDGLDVSVDRAEEDAASRFTRLYEEFTGES
ncbi:winged helix-turn-helix domain-containing protein [Halorientalis pallida]|uniref:ArsR family transcriptional regulator n=1 Tax=Halorientalis pallida TaxID=2479928 RepID=A0A498KZY1_9EURY|nr:helix-turn-helix domain-containing protein [Halorientalis pallida]RXK49033.1 ArsR family transcriptional regulator [Halorientalis pallida]